MKPKKIHEVTNFAQYINDLSCAVLRSHGHCISHIVDFGSGQNYLGRALACSSHCKSVIALESKQHNIEIARNMDIHAKLTEKPKIPRNKKLYRHSNSEGSRPTIGALPRVVPDGDSKIEEKEIERKFSSILA